MSRDRTADIYDAKSGSAVDQRLVRTRIHWMCARISGREVVDIGCGAGLAAVLLGREGCNVVGVDRDTAVLRQAERRRDVEDDAVKGRVRFASADAADLPFADEAFDTALLGNVLDEQIDRGRIVSEVARVLKADGLLVLTVPYGLVVESQYDAINVRDLLDLVLPEFSVDELRLIDRHIALAARKGAGELSAALAEQALEVAERRVHDVDIQLAAVQGAQQRARGAAEATAKEDRDQAEQLRDAMGDRETRIAELEARCAKLQAELGDSRSGGSAAGLARERDHKTVAELERQAKTAQRRLKERAQESDRRLQERDLRVAAVEFENDALRNRERDATARIAAADAAAAEALAEADRAKLDRHLLELEAANHARHAAELEAIESELRQRIDQLEADLLTGRRQQAGLAAERDALRAVLERARADIERVRAASLDAREAAARADARTERFERELSLLRTTKQMS